MFFAYKFAKFLELWMHLLVWFFMLAFTVLSWKWAKVVKFKETAASCKQM